MSNEQGRRIDDKRSNESLKWEEAQGGNSRLTDERIKEVAIEACLDAARISEALDFARMIEREVLSSHPMPAQAAATEQATIDTMKLMETIMANLLDRHGVFDDINDDVMEEIRAEMHGTICRALATQADAGAGLTTECTQPPEGWHCTRTAGHDGPCAAVPVNEDGYTEKEEAIYQRGLEDGKAVARGMERYRQGIARLSTPAAPVTAAELPAPDGWIATAVIGSELTSVAFRTEATAHKSCVTGAPFPFWKSAPAPVTADAGAAAPVSRDAVLEEAAKAVAHRGWTDAVSVIRALKSQPVAAAAGEDARDAARYRWLVQQYGVTALPCFLERLLQSGYVADGKQSIDAVLDAAMSPPFPVESAKQGGSDE